MKKYNDKHKHLKDFKDRKREVIKALQNTPRQYKPLNAHSLKGNMQGYYSISTGLNSNRDRVVYVIDDKNNKVVLKSIGDHSVYELMMVYWEENQLI